ncbi:MAG: aspartyl-phosphate phosphatase Spo0E family protein [Maledivibacter sp.]|nr:aspartyl-phosphate phosphatase Spo0E family protein [Maledivibacter sp.]
MNNINSLSIKIEKLRKELSSTLDNNLHDMSMDELVDQSNELNKLIVEYYRRTTNKED